MILYFGSIRPTYERDKYQRGGLMRLEYFIAWTAVVDVPWKAISRPDQKAEHRHQASTSP